MPLYTEDDITQAIRDIENRGSLRQAVRDWGVPYQTLRGRVQGRENHSNGAES